MLAAKMSRYALLVFAQAFSAVAAEPCADMAYENRNQIDYGPLALGRLRGKAVDQTGVPVPGVCVGLFRESDHSLTVATETSTNGQFELRNPPRGDYRLVATYPAFGTANARVRFGRGASIVVVRMRASGIDTTSYIEPK